MKEKNKEKKKSKEKDKKKRKSKHKTHKKSKKSKSNEDMISNIANAKETGSLCEHKEGYESILKNGTSIIKDLLTEFPLLAQDLVSLFDTLDKGQCVILDGLTNLMIKEKLNFLFLNIGLEKNAQGDKSFIKTNAYKDISLKEMFPVEKLVIIPTEIKRKRVIGPTLPTPENSKSVVEDEHLDDLIVGPVQPGEVGYREALVDIEEEDRIKERKQWKLLRNEAQPKPDIVSKLKREEWMVSVPKGNMTLEALQSGYTKPRQFRANAAPEVDDSWFASPEERALAERQKAQIELLGYVKNPVAALSSSSTTAKNVSTDQSIMPTANPQADAEIRDTMELLRASRGKSLVERHQENLKAEGKPSAHAQTWNRERDLTRRPELSQGQVSELITKASQLSSRFSQPKITRQFL